MRLTCALLRVRRPRELRRQFLLEHPALGRPLALSRLLRARLLLPRVLRVRLSLSRLLRVRLSLPRALRVRLSLPRALRVRLSLPRVLRLRLSLSWVLRLRLPLPRVLRVLRPVLLLARPPLLRRRGRTAARDEIGRQLATHVRAPDLPCVAGSRRQLRREAREELAQVLDVAREERLGRAVLRRRHHLRRLAHELRDALGMRVPGIEVLAQPVAQPQRLADVDDLASVVAKQVNARRVRDSAQPPLDCIFEGNRHADRF